MEFIGRKKFSCKYPGCNNHYFLNTTGDYVNKHFFRFPKDVDCHNIWRNVCNADRSQNTTNWQICEDHFNQRDFVNEAKQRLIPGSVPIPILAEISQFQNNSKSSEGIADEQFIGSEDLSILDDSVSLNCSCAGPSSSSTATCSHLDLPLSHVNEVTSNVCNLQDHSYYKVIGGNRERFSFLEEREDKGILHKIGVSRVDLSPKKSIMYRIHRNTSSKLSKLRTELYKERDNVNMLKKLYKSGKFQCIEENLNSVSRAFIDSQLRNLKCKPSARRWTEEDKAFALSVYKRSPRLYRYLKAYFYLPSTRTLKHILSKIPFDTGLNPAVFEYLEGQVSKMQCADRYCALLFDEVSLSQGLYYEHHKQLISGFEDLGSLGRRNRAANHALVFMVKGIRKQWKQIIAYYFTTASISTIDLKALIKEIICKLQGIGLNVVATVCDQGPTSKRAMSQLCSETHPKQSPYYFFVNEQPVVTIFDVPHLLKCTRNALLKCKIEFEPHKFAKFEYIQSAFNLDQQKSFKTLIKLKPEHFNFTHSYVKMKVKIAAAQLSNSVASVIETYSTLGKLPSESIFTAEFAKKIDDLFDSLNGHLIWAKESKPYRCALTATSPHLELWSRLLVELQQWKMIDLETGKDVTNRYPFVKSWQTSIKSMIFLWNHLQGVDQFEYLNLRGLNQDPVENLFCTIRQHGACNTNPTCHQFVAALKTVVVNKLVSPVGDGNCEKDACVPLDNLGSFFKYSSPEDEQMSESDIVSDFETMKTESLKCEDSQGLAYVAGYVLKKVIIPDCDNCRSKLFCDNISSHHLFTSFKEMDDRTRRLNYASEHVMLLLKNIHDNLYKFLDEHGFQSSLEDKFKEIYVTNRGPAEVYCTEHDCDGLILEKCVPFLIFKYVKDRNKSTSGSSSTKKNS